jgi:hypothetical protein
MNLLKQPLTPSRLAIAIGLGLGFGQGSLRAQSVITVRVPQSLVTRSAADAAKESAAQAAAACRVTAKGIRISDSTAQKARDTVHVQVQNDRDEVVGAPANLTFRIGDKGGVLDKSNALATVVADSGSSLAGTVVEVWRSEDQIRVCSAKLAGAAKDTVPDDTTRYPFRVGIGASFTPLGGASKTDLYYDVTVFLSDAFGAGAQHSSRWGIDAGLTNGRLGLRNDTTPQVTAVVNVLRPTRDSIATITRTFTSTRTTTVDNLGLYLGPTFRLSSGFYWTVRAEADKRDYIDKTHDRVTELDTVVTAGTVPPSNAPRTVRPPTADVAGDTVRTRRYTTYDAFYGTGPLLVRRQSTIEFRANAIFGVGPAAEATKGQYVITFRVTDFATGFKLGGEVRGLLKNSAPGLFIFLAKDFDFKKLASFIASGDSS